MCKNYVDKQDAYRAAVEYRSQAVEKKIQEIVAMVRSILGPPDDHATPANNSDGAPLPSVSEGVSTESLPAVSEIFNRIKFYRFLNKWECDGLENGVQVRKWFSATGRSRTGALREALHWYLRHSTPRHPETYQSQLTIPKDIRWKTGAWEVHHSDVHAQRSLVLFKVDDNTPAEVALASAVRHRDRLINKKVEALIQVYEQETRDRLTRQT
ncbi:MAG: hypothetical protein KVP17_000948 [Porospora cf. gigantea B]|uniref:uncharacterized protein n=1 Tax=Porospora cf. gigantea B TaxID=2853592 RepID=UPI0035719997|nr:MAG: hypothetical protein KVP17_000948 [Porospora cf. gigantea B]